MTDRQMSGSSPRIFDRENSMYGKLIALWTNSPDQDFEYYREMAPFKEAPLPMVTSRDAPVWV